MANIKVCELSPTACFNDGDYSMIIQNNENKKIVKENMLGGFNKNLLVGQYLKANMENDYVIQVTETTETLPFNTAVEKICNNLTIYNNGIKVGSGINHILITSQVYLYNNVNRTELIQYFYLNDTNILTNNTKMSNNY